jgi:hypothetical protein
MENEGVDNEYLEMKLPTKSLTEDSQMWFKCFPENHLESYENFAKLLKSRWETKKDSGMLMTQFNHIKNKDNETMNEFYTRFDNLCSQIPKYLCPFEAAICILNVNVFEGKFGFILRDKKPNTLEKSKEYNEEIKENIIYSKI